MIDEARKETIDGMSLWRRGLMSEEPDELLIGKQGGLGLNVVEHFRKLIANEKSNDGGEYLQGDKENANGANGAFSNL